jgi:two-component system, NarL family, invasion response regulator UvrY
MDQARALIVDDHPVIRDGIKQLLQQTFPSMNVADSAGTSEVVEEICGKPWTFVLLDINLPAQNGLHLIKKIQTHRPDIPIIVFSLFSEEQYESRALRAGAAAFVSKARSVLELVEVIKSVLRREKPVIESTARVDLSARESEVLSLLAQGLSRQAIAQALGIDETTVSTYRARLLQKLNARTTLDLLRLAADEGLLPPG